MSDREDGEYNMSFSFDKRKRLRPMTHQEYKELIHVAKGQVKADVYFQGGTVCNVYSGEWIQTNVALKGRRIAYVGQSVSMIGENTRVIDAKGQYLVPGYIEPHAHPFQLYNPFTLAQFALIHGTTVLVNDNLMLYLTMPHERLEEFFREAGEWPVKMMWWARLDPQTSAPETEARFAPEHIRRLLDNPYVVQAGELTAWPRLFTGDDELALNLLQTSYVGKKIEGHLPGASVETLAAMTAAGVTACHEAMTGEEAMRRLRLGLWTVLRYSSLRPDLPVLIRELLPHPMDWSRMMMTTDGSTPPFLEKGMTDEMVRVAMENGLDPMKAYQLVTIQPATYYGIDSEVGGIGPGRIADLLLLSDPMNPTPLEVWAEGQRASSHGQLQINWKEPDWEYYGQHPLFAEWRVTKDDFYLQEDERQILLCLENPAIIRLQKEYSECSDGDLTGALLSRDGKQIVRATVRGFARHVEGLASSYTASGGYLVIGKKPEAMEQALNRVLQMGGGIVFVEEGQVVFELPLPLSGKMCQRPIEELIRESKTFEQMLVDRGYPHYDLLYTLLFLSSTHLPEVRFTSQGILHVKTGDILVPAKNRETLLR